MAVKQGERVAGLQPQHVNHMVRLRGGNPAFAVRGDFAGKI